MVVTGAWWDVVDAVAAHLLGELLRKETRTMRREILAWARCGDLWKRRSAILCQLGSRERTDVALLHACIGPSLDSREFFLRKAIGWALRQHARTDPVGVRRYVAENADRLSGLSRREATKHLG
jgi:3-methyladenine DNA glycosylase AlkD